MQCKNCGYDSEGKFCPACGQKLNVGRITLSAVVHDVIHTYTHFDTGFLYTLKQLAIHPGTLQRNFLKGHRVKNQKPFPMFIAAGTICALALYLIYIPTAETETDQYFFKHYYVLAQAAMLPVYTVTTWTLFSSSRLNFAEILTLELYMVGFMSLIIVPINLFHFFLDNGIITLIEIVLLTGYNVWTFLNFFNDKPKWLITIKSVINVVVNFILFQIVANLIIKWFMHG